MRSLYEIAVSVQSSEDIDDPLHCEITVEDSSADWAIGRPGWDPNLTEADAAASRRIMAGVLGRLATVCIQEMDKERANHTCRPTFYREGGPSFDDCCQIASNSLADHDHDFGSPVCIYFIVPKGRQKHWVELISRWLQMIAKADQ